MTRGEDFPEWERLGTALLALVEACGARNAFVLDAWANLWCSGNAYDGPDGDLAMDLAHELLSSLAVPLNRGGRIDRVEHRSFLKSFAGIYVLALLFDGPFSPAQVRAAIDKALPGIEALTLLLPPPEGPDAGGAQGSGIA
jgi:hypothetical protein